jgi:hypothetical protein
MEKPMRPIAIPLVALAFVACGGSSSSGPTEAVMNITASGISSSANSSNITIPSGGRIHYFNKDTVAHQINSNCPEMAMTAPLAAGGNQLQPIIGGPQNCSLTDTANAAAVASVSVSAPSAAGGGGGSGY